MASPFSPTMAELRDRMVAVLRHRDIREERVLAAMRSVPREEFVPEWAYERAYDDTALAIGQEQTISQPYVVAMMLQLAEIAPDARVLEVGTGSGYAAALLSRLAAQVFTIERQPMLFEISRERLARLGFANVRCRFGDGTAGWPEEAPFEAIMVSAGTPEAPDALLVQLGQAGGRMIIPVGPQPSYQRLLRISRHDATTYETEDFGPVSFVPLVRD